MQRCDCFGARFLSGQTVILRDRQCGNRSLGAEPLAVDLLVGAGSDHLLEAFVDLVEQFGVALTHGNTEILIFKACVARHVEVFVGVLLRIVGKDTDVAHGSVNAARVEFFKGEASKLTITSVNCFRCILMLSFLFFKTRKNG